jgi:hypothetical protein
MDVVIADDDHQVSRHPSFAETAIDLSHGAVSTAAVVKSGDAQ